jgi:hypothetical protein
LVVSRLVSGFATRTMDIEVRVTPLEVTWQAPESARYVACGVFTCNPTFRDRPRMNPADETPDHEALRMIASPESCLLEHHVVDTSRDSIAFGRIPPPTAPPCTPEADRVFEPIINFFAVGCWAYDDHAVIAASDLQWLSPDIVRPWYDDVPSTTCAIDFAPCYHEDKQYFGSCLAGVCQPRCTSAVDCELTARRLFDAPEDETCHWACRDLPDGRSSAGVCEPLP